MKRIALAVVALTAAAGFASNANAARFYLTAGGTLYSGNLGSNSTVSASLGLGNNERSPAIAFDSNRNLYAAVNNQGSTEADLYRVSGFQDLNSFNPGVTFVSELVSPTNSFDFVGSGANEQLIGTRNRLASDGSGPNNSGMIYFESTSNSYNAFVSDPANNGSFGNGSLPSTGYDSDNNVYYGVTDGVSDNNRRIVTIDRNTGLVSQLQVNNVNLSMVFDGVDDAGDAGYGTIVLAGGDFFDGTYYISFWSAGLQAAVIGSLNLSDGAFTQLSAFNVGSQPVSMGLAITVIPTPLAGGMSVAGLMFVGARRRRNA
jgi:hypothetical protein